MADTTEMNETAIGTQPPPAWEPRIVAFLCNWCSYAGADLAGVSRLQYPAHVRVIRVPCSGRVNPLYLVKALQQAIRQVYAREALPQGIGGGTVAAFFRKAGLPAAVWMTANDCAHQPNEFCFLSHLLGDAKVLAHVCLLAE